MFYQPETIAQHFAFIFHSRRVSSGHLWFSKPLRNFSFNFLKSFFSDFSEFVKKIVVQNPLNSLHVTQNSWIASSIYWPIQEFSSLRNSFGDRNQLQSHFYTVMTFWSRKSRKALTKKSFIYVSFVLWSEQFLFFFIFFISVKLDSLSVVPFWCSHILCGGWKKAKKERDFHSQSAAMLIFSGKIEFVFDFRKIFQISLRRLMCFGTLSVDSWL